MVTFCPVCFRLVPYFALQGCLVIEVHCREVREDRSFTRCSGSGRRIDNVKA